MTTPPIGINALARILDSIQETTSHDPHVATCPKCGFSRADLLHPPQLRVKRYGPKPPSATACPVCHTIARYAPPKPDPLPPNLRKAVNAAKGHPLPPDDDE